MWGFTGILGVLIKLDALTIVWHRLIIAAVSLVIAMFFLKESFKVSSRKRLLSLYLVGFVVGLHWFTFYWSIQLSTASLGILCLSTTTVHVAWLEPLIMRRPFSWLEMLLSLSVVFGIYFVANDFNVNHLWALGVGLSSAFFAALFAVYNAKFAENDRPAVITLYEMLGAAILMTVFLLIKGELNAGLFTMTVSDLLWLLFLGTLCTSAAFLIVVQIIKRLGAFTVSLSINLEPIYTIVLAIFILDEHEKLDQKFYWGAVIIFAVVLLNAVLKSPRLKKRKTTESAATKKA